MSRPSAFVGIVINSDLACGSIVVINSVSALRSVSLVNSAVDSELVFVMNSPFAEESVMMRFVVPGESFLMTCISSVDDWTVESDVTVVITAVVVASG